MQRLIKFGRQIGPAIALWACACAASASGPQVDAAARLLAQYYAIEESAAFCDAFAPSAAPGLEDTFASWDKRSQPAVLRVQAALTRLLAADLKQGARSDAVQAELRANLRATRNAVAVHQREALTAMTPADLTDHCRALDETLRAPSATLETRSPKDWRLLFVERPAGAQSVVGDWTSEPACVGELWTLWPDGREAISNPDEEDGYTYRGYFTLVNGVYRSKGTENAQSTVTLAGQIMAELTTNRQVKTLDLTLSGGQGEQSSTITYHRCGPVGTRRHTTAGWPAGAGAQE